MLKDFGKKISKACQSAVEEAKKAAEIVSVNTKISRKESEMKEIFTKLGEQFYTANVDKENTEFADTFAQIKSIVDEIKSYEDRVEELKAVTKCPQCGNEVSKSVTFCSSCGSKVEHKLPEVVEVEEYLCSACNKPMEEDAQFCPFCGAKNDAE